jgi:hypothetical protein
MVLHKVTIGIRFNKRSFNLASFGGHLIDCILDLREDNKDINDSYFTKFSSKTDLSNLFIQFLDDNGTNTLQIEGDQIVFIKSSCNENSSLNIDKVIKEFEILWETANKVLKFPHSRRIGLVGEYRHVTEDKTPPSIKLAETLLNLPAPSNKGTFTLQYEDPENVTKGDFFDKKTSDFWNCIYTYRAVEENKEKDQKESIELCLDVQKYYNPAKSKPLRELKSIKTKYLAKKKEFKETNLRLGLIDK